MSLSQRESAWAEPLVDRAQSGPRRGAGLGGSHHFPPGAQRGKGPGGRETELSQPWRAGGELSGQAGDPISGVAGFRWSLDFPL